MLSGALIVTGPAAPGVYTTFTREASMPSKFPTFIVLVTMFDDGRRWLFVMAHDGITDRASTENAIAKCFITSIVLVIPYIYDTGNAGKLHSPACRLKIKS